jgi:hypothetical protein
LDLGREIQHLSAEEISALIRSKDSAFVKMKSTEQPWILLQRPRNRYIVCLKKESPNRLDVPIRSQDEVSLWTLLEVDRFSCFVFTVSASPFG